MGICDESSSFTAFASNFVNTLTFVNIGFSSSNVEILCGHLRRALFIFCVGQDNF